MISDEKQLETHKFYHYIVVRKDLPLGFLSAQVAHASGESVSNPIATGTHAIVLEVDNEVQLRALADRLTQSEIAHKLIIEIDKPYTGQATAIGIEPTCNRKKIRKLTSNFPLLGKKKELRRRSVLDICSQFIADLRHHTFQ